MIPIKQLAPTTPETLSVAPRMAAQRQATAALVRPMEVAGVAALLAPWVAPGAAEADQVTHWLRGLRYLPDRLNSDVWQAPLATLLRGGGDCEDLSIAALSVLMALGCPGVLVIGMMYQRSGVIAHAWVEGWDSMSWFHLEATAPGLTRFARPPNYVPYAVYPPASPGLLH